MSLNLSQGKHRVDDDDDDVGDDVVHDLDDDDDGHGDHGCDEDEDVEYLPLVS